MFLKRVLSFPRKREGGRGRGSFPSIQPLTKAPKAPLRFLRSQTQQHNRDQPGRRLTCQFPSQVCGHFGEHVSAELIDVSFGGLLGFLSCLHRSIIWPGGGWDGSVWE